MLCRWLWRIATLLHCDYSGESGAPALGIIVRVYGKNSSKYYVAELDSLVIGDIFFFPTLWGE